MLAAYTARYPDERAAMEPFVRYVASFDTPALYDRKNFVGHLTAGALIVSRQTGCVLLLKHKQLGKWLQPGARCRFPGGARGDGDRSGPAGAARAERLLAAGSGRCGRALHSALPEQGRGRTSAFRHALRFPVRRRSSGRDRPGRVGRFPLGYARRIGLDARFPADRAEDPGRLVRAGNRLLASCRPRGGLPVERTIGNGRPVCLSRRGMFGRSRFPCLYCAGMPVVVPGHAPIPNRWSSNGAKF